MIDVQLPGRWNEYVQIISNANTTQGKILVDVAPPFVDPAITTPIAETAIPGESGLRQRVFTGGQRVIDGSIASSDTAASSVYIYIGQQTSLYADMGAPTITTTTITRSVGSFITDGYQVGDGIMVFGGTQAANNGVARAITAVATGTLTFAASSFTADSGLVAGFRVFRIALRTRRALPASSGFLDATPPVVLMGGTQDPASAAQPDIGWSLSFRGVVIVAMVATITSGTFVYFHAMSTLY